MFCRYVRFGEYDVTDYSRHKPKESPVSSLIVHEQYNNKNHDNDIGLMRLVRDIEFDSEYSSIMINNGADCMIKIPNEYTSFNIKINLFLTLDTIQISSHN